MNRRVLWLGVALLSASSAWANDVERIAMAQVRLSTEAAVAAGCSRLGRVSDDSIKDVRKKIVRAGGNTGVLSFGIDDLSKIYAEVYRCPATASPAPAVNVPANIPPPPAGMPPPPPPGLSR